MEDVYQQIYKVHSQWLNFNGIRTKPVLVVFSAIPGSGKSELTKRLAATYGFFRVANKDIRNALETTGHAHDVVIAEYTLWFLDKVTSEGPLSIVFDRNIDQWYGPSKDWARANGYLHILVRIDVERKTLQERLLRREGDSNARVFGVMDFYDEQHKTMANAIQPDIILKENYDLDAAARCIASC